MSAFVGFVGLFVLWLLLTLNITIVNIIAAVVAAFFATLFFGKYALKVNIKILQPWRYFWAFIYLFVFLWECIKANFDVAYRVLHPRLPVKPGIVKAESTLTTDIAKVFLANSITMTPGTITLDIINNSFFIHWIYVRSTDPEEYTNRILGRFEKFLKRIFE